MPDCEDRFKDLFPDTSEPVLVLCDPVFSHCAGGEWCIKG